MVAEIEKRLELDCSPEDVWRALTDPTEVAGWFGDSAEFSPSPGSQGWFGWQEHGKFAMQVEHFEPPHRFVWRWARQADKPLEETESTLIEWTLIRRHDGGTTLLLKESGFVTEEYRKLNDGGWDEELGDLSEFLARA